MTLSPAAGLCARTDEAAAKAATLHSVAIAIADRLAQAGLLSRQALARMMREAFGATDASGAWSMRDAYDALEAGQVLFLRDEATSPLGLADPAGILSALQDIERGLPTQTYRSEHQVDFQQFSTPVALAWLASLCAQVSDNDVVLEPSAGTGMLTVLAARAGAALHLNERDPLRAGLLAKIAGQAVTSYDGAAIDTWLPASFAPDVVLINPPFSRSEERGRDRHAGARHLRSALVRLRASGRCVAIMASGFTAEGTGRTGYASVSEVVRPRVEIDIAADVYAKHGTSTRIRLLIFDKGWAGETSHIAVDTLAEALPHVLALPPRLAPPPESPAPTPAPRPVCTRGPALSLFSGSKSARTIAPPMRETVDAEASLTESRKPTLGIRMSFGCDRLPIHSDG